MLIEAIAVDNLLGKFCQYYCPSLHTTKYQYYCPSLHTTKERIQAITKWHSEA